MYGFVCAGGWLAYAKATWNIDVNSVVATAIREFHVGHILVTYSTVPTITSRQGAISREVIIWKKILDAVSEV